MLRLASVLWRLRRATEIETALFEFVMRQSRRSMSRSTDKTPTIFIEQREGSERLEKSGANTNKIAEIFLRLSDLPTCPMDRLSRYEHRLWRQARQIVLTLKASRRGTHVQKAPIRQSHSAATALSSCVKSAASCTATAQPENGITMSGPNAD